MQAKVRRGVCKLCLQQDLVLRDSHYIPKGVYRTLRTEEDSNPHPMMLTASSLVQTSKQSRAHLLCEACEGLLDRNGENWVLKHFLKADGSFKLDELLRQKPPLVNDCDKYRFHLAAEVPGLNVHALSYFAMSVFWRGSIHPWNRDGSIPVPLGSYGERLRKYLHGDGQFPKDVALHLYVRDAGNLSRLMAEPWGGRFDGARMYRFVLPGLVFVLYVGQRISAKLREYCFVTGEAHPMVVTSEHEPYLEELARALMQSSAKRGGQRTG